MKQRHILLILLSLFVSVLQAATVNKQDALQKAQQFVAGRQAAARGGAGQAQSLQSALDNSYYYVFNIGTDGGFVIVSGDDRTPEILGYSDAGHFDAQNIPDNMRAFLQGYADEIQNLPETMPAASRGVGQKRVVKTPISPLLVSEWDQSEPYYNNLPTFYDNDKCLTGCVATAMAQVLYYLKYPSATTQVIPGYNINFNIGGDPYLLEVPEVAVTTFAWNKMLPTYSGGEANDEKAAVAALMQCCGTSVGMTYRSYAYGGSSASLASIPHALKTYFGFDNNVQYRNRSLYTTTEWEDMIYTELAAARPVLYGGQSSGGGHAFVCDGFDGDGYYHINWGWSGNHNGFFLLAVLNPYDTSGAGASSKPDGYTMSQDAIIGLRTPNGNTDSEGVRMTVNKFAYDNSTLTYDKNSFPLHYSYSLTNNLSDTYDVTVACDIFDSNNQFVRNLTTWHVMDYDNNVCWDSWESGKTMSGDGSIGYFNLNELADGTYKLKLRSKLTSDDTYYECVNADKYYIQAVVSGSQVTFSNVVPTVSLTASDITLTTDGIVNTVQTVTAKITNNGDAYHGTVYLFVGGENVSGNGLSVEAGQKAMAYFSFKPTTAGTKTVKICTDENGSNQIGTGSITIKTTAADEIVLPSVHYEVDMSAVSNIDMNSYEKLSGQNIVTVDAFSSSSSLRFRYVNNSSSQVTGLMLAIAKYDGSTYNDYTWTTSAYTLSAGNPTGWINVANFLDGYGKYEIRLYKNSTRSTENLVDNHLRIELVKGYVAQTADGQQMVKVTDETPHVDNGVMAVEMDATIITDIIPNSNPNTLYVITNGTAPASLDDKNVIVGNTATKIELTDGNSFASPIDFTATEINYSRAITNGTDGMGSGWTTIVLPFDVEEVWAVGNEESEQIDWFHNEAQTTGRFWVRKFVNDAADNVIFDFTDKIEANTPYIIAVPGSKWGNQWDLTGKTLVFKASDGSVSAGAKTSVTGDSYKFTGTMQPQSLNDVYVLNAAGSTFVKSTGTVAPFRAYFKSMTLSKASSLYITSPSDVPTTIGQLPAEIATPAAMPKVVYTLDGRRVTSSQMKKGVYIVGGKKIIK